MPEQWKPIPSFEGRYEVSNAGGVRNVNTGRLLRQGGVNGGGYRVVTLYADGIGTPVAVHRLMMLAFVGPCPEGMNVNHKSGVKTENWLSNLEYCTFSENIRHAHAHGLTRPRGPTVGPTKPCNVGSANKHASIDEPCAVLIRSRLAAGEPSAAIARALKISPWIVYNIKYGRRWKHAG